MLYAAGIAAYALWHIFLPEHTDILCEYIQKHCRHDGPGHPIHSQEVYFTPYHLGLLYEEYGIRPYEFRQYPFDAVHIPAGCVHQVLASVQCTEIAFTDPFSFSRWPTWDAASKLQLILSQYGAYRGFNLSKKANDSTV